MIKSSRHSRHYVVRLLSPIRIARLSLLGALFLNENLSLINIMPSTIRTIIDWLVITMQLAYYTQLKMIT